MDGKTTIPWRQLPPSPEGRTFSLEWNVYREILPQLLSDGHEGKFALIHAHTLFGVFSSWNEARSVGLKRFDLAPFFVHVIRGEEPILRIRGISMPVHRFRYHAA